MKEITLVVEDKVGVLADISYILGKARINIESLSAVSMDGKAILTIFVKDEKKAKELLRSNSYRVLEDEVMVVRLKDSPGELSKISNELAAEKINILNLFVVAKEKGTSIVALKVDKPKKAKGVLGPYMKIED